MAMRVSTLDILTERGRFDPAVARAVAEAIENKIHGNELVTIPSLDARLGGLRHDLGALRHGLELKIEGLKSEFSHRMYMALLGQMAVMLGAVYFMLSHLR